MIAVSSTVIPLAELTVSSHDDSHSIQPKLLSRLDMKRMLRKHHLTEEDPHELITGGWNFLFITFHKVYIFGYLYTELDIVINGLVLKNT